MTEIVLIRAVNKQKNLVDIEIETKQKTKHRIGHLPGEGWFCICAKGTRCAQIQHVKKLVIEMEK